VIFEYLLCADTDKWRNEAGKPSFGTKIVLKLFEVKETFHLARKIVWGADDSEVIVRTYPSALVAIGRWSRASHWGISPRLATGSQ
jgi:hypothetical protein